MVLEVFLDVKGQTKKMPFLMSLREGIVNSEKVKAFYRKYTVEDGAVVTLDNALASEHVRQCINDLKRPRVKHPFFNSPKTDDKVCLCIHKVNVYSQHRFTLEHLWSVRNG